MVPQLNLRHEDERDNSSREIADWVPPILADNVSKKVSGIRRRWLSEAVEPSAELLASICSRPYAGISTKHQSKVVASSVRRIRIGIKAAEFGFAVVLIVTDLRNRESKSYGELRLSPQAHQLILRFLLLNQS